MPPTSRLLPRLRHDLEVMPSPVPEQPGLMIRDPYRFSDQTLIVPPLLARCLSCFDGQQSEMDLRERLTRLTGQVVVGEPAAHLIEALGEAGFLEDDVFAEMKGRREQAFRSAPHRSAVHAGGGYPAERQPLGDTLARSIGDGKTSASRGPLRGIAAPHVSPEGGFPSYGAAYGALPTDDGLGDRTFVILGTSHYGQPDRFGLTRKPFATPFGRTNTDSALVDALIRHAGADAIQEEDYCHAIEHSVEFQVVYLQHLFGANVRILPVLCGPFLTAHSGRRLPEENDAVAAFLGALGELNAKHGQRLFWVLGIDMAHVGARYGDAFHARAGEGPLLQTEARDRTRIDRINAGDAAGFWDLIGENGGDDLKWCGSSPIYTFLRAVPEAKGQLLRYQQWNIDPASVVSFAALGFS
ncbi:MAG TPA: AmmeMemoRadiSam system protein B [Polyangia bacterium]|nr:AmmeMemoRadiSam system protein B [Polyangia bacterium]